MVTRQNVILDDIVTKLGVLKEQNEQLIIPNNKDILAKLDKIIEQNTQIIKENKNLKEQNFNIIKHNNELKDTIEKSEKTIQELQAQTNKVLENGEKIEIKTNNIVEKVLLNDKAPNTRIQQQTPERHSLLISPANETETSQTTWSEVAKEKITQKLSNVQVNKLVITRKGQCYINLPNKTNQDKALENLKDEYNVKAETKVIGLTPKITVCDLDPSVYTTKDQDTLKNDIMSKNPEILKMVEEQKTFEVLFIQETSQSGNRAIIRIDPEILNHLNNLKHIRRTNAVIYVQNTACRFFNRFHIIQCYQCQSFGHRKGSSSCPLGSTNRNICLYCNRNHQSKECTVKRQPDRFKCANCTRFHIEEDEETEGQNLNHTTTDHACPIFQKQIENILKNTRGVGNCSKNDFAKHVFIT